MTSLSILLGMAENNAWANLRFYRACAKLSDSDLRAKRTSFFPSIHATLVHNAWVDEYYFDALVRGGRGRAIFENEERFHDFEALRAAQAAVDSKLVAFLAGLKDEAALDVKVDLARRNNHTQVETVGLVLLHLFEHQIHHRGQAHAMLAGTHVEPPQLDEFFLAEELPLRESELRELGLRVR